MYYVVHSLSNLSRVAIHLEAHAHFVSKGKCKKSLEEMMSMVVEEVLRMPNATSFAISLATSKAFLSCHFFIKDGEVFMEFLKCEKSNQAMSMFVPLCFPNIHNLVSSIKHRLGNMGSLDSILMFKSLSPYDYI
jgi:hypothetical protein